MTDKKNMASAYSQLMEWKSQTGPDVL